MVRPDDSAVDHLQAGLAFATVIAGFKDKVPETRQRPAPELAVDRRPFPKTIRQVAPGNASPGNPENPVQNKPVVPGTPPAASPALNHKRLKADPFLVAHQSPDHDSLRQSYLESVFS